MAQVAPVTGITHSDHRVGFDSFLHQLPCTWHWPHSARKRTPGFVLELPSESPSSVIEPVPARNMSPKGFWLPWALWQVRQLGVRLAGAAGQVEPWVPQSPEGLITLTRYALLAKTDKLECPPPTAPMFASAVG